MSKVFGCICSGIVSAGATIGGVALMATGVGAIAGSALLSTGISGISNTIQQAVSDKKDYDYGSFLKDTTIGAATGVATMGLGAAASGVKVAS